MKLSPYTKAALAAVCCGVGIALFASAVADVKSLCVDCEDDPAATVTEVATASAELAEGEA